jgi:predicted secreted protein
MIHEVGFDQNEQTLHVSPGDIIRLELEENPTTGYSWSSPETDSFLSMMKNDYSLHQARGIGSGGMRTIEMKVEQSGSSSLQLKNWQRWSGDVYQTFQLNIQSA